MHSALILIAALSSVPGSKSMASAYRDGDITVAASSHSGHSIAELEIENQRRKNLVVDVNGSYLIPEASTVQRLGLGLLQAGNGDTVVRLKPRGRLRIKVLSVCMDSKKSSPGGESKLRLAKKLAPRKVLRVMRQWRSRPNVSQSVVQSVVWGSAPSLDGAPTSRNISGGELQIAMEYATLNQRVFTLTRDGELFGGPWSRPSRLLDRRVMDLHVDTRLLVIRRAPPRPPRRAADLVISQYDADTGAWGDLFKAVPGRLLWVAKNGAEAVIHTSEDVVVRIDESSMTRLFKKPRSVSVTPDGTVYWVPDNSVMELYGRARGGKASRVLRSAEPIRTVASPGEWPYVLDRRGNLIYVSGKPGKRPTRLNVGVVAIQSVGKRLLAKTQPSQRAETRIPARLLICEGARTVLDVPLPPHLPRHYLHDGESNLLSVDAGFFLRILNPEERKWEVLMRLGKSPSGG